MTLSLGAEFLRVGPEVPFGVAEVAYGEVSPLRDIIAGDFVQATTTQASRFDFDSSSTAGALFFRAIGEPGKETPNRTVAAKIAQDAIPAGWRLTAKVATYGRNEGNVDSKLMYYRVETVGEEVLVAIKAVGFIIEKSEIVIADDIPYERFVAQKKMYERPMTSRDCVALRDTLQSAVRRAPQRTRDPAIDNYVWVEENTIGEDWIDEV